MNGLLVFVVPGPDAYSVAQGVRTAEPGALEAAVTDIYINSLDESAPYLPQFSQIVAGLLNNLALAVDPGASGKSEMAGTRPSDNGLPQLVEEF